MIKIFKDKNSLSIGAAELFSQCAGKAIRKRGTFLVALSGGGTPRGMYETLASPLYRDRVDWEHTEVFWGDERCVSICDERSNCGMAFQYLLGRIPIPRENIHPILCEENPSRGAKEYEKFLRAFFKGQRPRFDLILLGLGENGHTASLFPGTGILHEMNNLVGCLHVKKEKYRRVSLTAPAINQAAVVAFMVTGASKASVLRDVLEGPFDPDRLPAQMIKPVDGELLWLIDRDAASLLTNISGETGKLL